MKKTLAIITGISLLVLASCTRDEDVITPITEENVVLTEQESDEFLTVEEINTIIKWIIHPRISIPLFLPNTR